MITEMKLKLFFENEIMKLAWTKT